MMQWAHSSVHRADLIGFLKAGKTQCTMTLPSLAQFVTLEFKPEQKK